MCASCFQDLNKKLSQPGIPFFEKLFELVFYNAPVEPKEFLSESIAEWASSHNRSAVKLKHDDQ